MQVITNGILEVSIKEAGAELWSIKELATKEEFMWEANPEYWGKKAPVLFPFIGGLRDGKYTYNGREYKGTKHGFARDNEFEVVEKLEDKVVFKLSSNEITLEEYPFEFDLFIIYSFDQNELITDYKIVNRGSNKMYFNLGGHPAFATPTNKDIKMSDYYLEFENDEKASTFMVDGVLLAKEKKPYLDGKLINLEKDTFKEDALVFERLNSSVLTIKNKKTTREVRVEYKDFPILALWNVPGADYVCIEPWCGINDYADASGNIEEKYAVEVLESGEVFERAIKVRVNS